MRPRRKDILDLNIETDIVIEIESSLGEKDREMKRKIEIKIGTERDRKGYSERHTKIQSQR